MQALFSWDVTGATVEELSLLRWVDRQQDREDTLTYARMLIAGTIEQIDQIDAIIVRHLSHWKLERLAQVDRAILRFSTYSMLFQFDLPAGVIIDEAVGIAKEFGSDESYRFVNGVLDAIRRSARESSEAQ